MKQYLIYKNENIKKYKSKFKKDQDRVYTSFETDRNSKYKDLSLCEYKNEEKHLPNFKNALPATIFRPQRATGSYDFRIAGLEFYRIILYTNTTVLVMLARQFVLKAVNKI